MVFYKYFFVLFINRHYFTTFVLLVCHYSNPRQTRIPQRGWVCDWLKGSDFLFPSRFLSSKNFEIC